MRAATKLPPNFPAVATRMIKPHRIQSDAPLTRPICVRMPVKAKKAGRSSTTTRSSSFSSSSRAMRDEGGTMAPRKKAPKMAWMPMNSVASAEARSVTHTTDMTPRVRPCPSRARM
jgi:hypothetical protein